ncbi:MAG: rhodanese-like domain-containing protein, partial [Chloroflexi bacterium]|nr:rhodanese-like domain-containing protein [Chloroflexota bacterium]
MTAMRQLRHSAVLETDAATPSAAVVHFRARLSFETDPADLATDLAKGRTDLLVVDTRSPRMFAAGH